MKHTIWPHLLAVLGLVLFLATTSAAPYAGALATVGTGFTYQGRLKEGGVPAHGAYDFQFSLFDAVSGGSQIGSTVTQDDVSVSNGLFTVQLDFGSVFDGTALWLEIAVRQGSSTGSYTPLGPRQPLMAAPYAQYSQNAPWNGISNVPPDLADGDDDTTYAAGFGLDLNSTVFDVNTKTVQARVSGECAVGQAIQAILEDGTVVCQSIFDSALSARQAFSHNIVDQNGDVGNDPSITIGVDGLPIISHYASDDDDLKVSHCNDPACNSATSTILEANSEKYSAITIGVDGLPLISYVHSSGALKVAHCQDLYCNSADIFTVDATSSMAHHSIAIGADGLGLISYQDAQNGRLKVAHCEQLACSTQTISTLASSLGTGSDYNSIVIGADGLGLILYRHISNNTIYLAHCDTIICNTATISLVSGIGGGFSSSLAIGANGLGVFSYIIINSGKYSLYAGRCQNLTCTNNSTTLFLSQFGVAGDPIRTSIATGADGIPLIAYDYGNLHVVRCIAVDCQGGSSSMTLPVDGKQPAMVIGADGLPAIAFQDGSKQQLEVVRTMLGRGTPYR